MSKADALGAVVGGGLVSIGTGWQWGLAWALIVAGTLLVLFSFIGRRA